MDLEAEVQAQFHDMQPMSNAGPADEAMVSCSEDESDSAEQKWCRLLEEGFREWSLHDLEEFADEVRPVHTFTS